MTKYAIRVSDQMLDTVQALLGEKNAFFKDVYMLIEPLEEDTFRITLVPETSLLGQDGYAKDDIIFM